MVKSCSVVVPIIFQKKLFGKSCLFFNEILGHDFEYFWEKQEIRNSLSSYFYESIN